MDYEHILLSRGPIATLTLNRQQVRNAMSDQTLREITDAFKTLSKDTELRAVLIKGEGPDFCAGADIAWMKKSGKLKGPAALKDAGLLIEAGRAIENCPVPVVVLAHGHVFGGGLGLLAACDIALADDNAKMCFSEVRLGIIPAAISCFAIPKIGESNARRYYLTAEFFGAKEAKSIGLIHDIWPTFEWPQRLEELKKRILQNGPQAVRAAKSLILKFRGLSFEGRKSLALKTLVRLRSSSQGQEGLGAFLEKRPPEWVEQKTTSAES